MMISRIFFFLIVLLLSARAQQTVYINEFMASNVSTHADLFDYDDFSDWIELYNDSDQAADISGYYLSDDPDNPCRWSIPQGTQIAAKSFLLIWADGNDDEPGKTYRRDYYPNSYFTTKFYHTNFKLGRAAEWLGLTSPDSIILDSLSFDLQYPDISYGRKMDGSATWIYHQQATPGAINDTSSVTLFEESGEPEFNYSSGIYSAALSVEISVTEPGARVTYTLNGANPKLSSTEYTGPIEITETTVIRARVFEPGKIPGKIITRSYFIDDSFGLPVISLTVDPAFFWDNNIGIYDKTLKKREVPVNFEMFDSSGSSTYYVDAGLSLTGQASVLYEQKSFTISAKDRYGQDTFDKQFFPARKMNTFKDIYLRNGGVPDHRNTMFRDALQATLIENKMDLDYQAYQPNIVFINGRYWGIYNLREKISADQLGLTYNLNPDDIDLLEYNLDYRPEEADGNRDNYMQLIDFFENADLQDPEQYQVVTDWIDIDEYINYQIGEIYCDNINAVDQNVRMWRERRDGAKWRWILYDMDYGFGMPNYRSSGYSNNTMEFATSANNGPYIPPLWSTLIFRKLLENNDFKNKFIQRFATYLNTVFYPDTVLAVIDSLQNRIYPEMNRNIIRWRNGGYINNAYPIQSMGEWISNVNVMKDFAYFRPTYQRNHIKDYFGLQDMVQIYLDVTLPRAGTVYINEVAKTESQHTGLYFNGIAVTLRAIPKVGYKFVKWQGLADSLNPQVTFIPNDESLEIVAVFSEADVNILPKIIDHDTTLTLVNSPYYANSDIVVNSGVLLTIEGGTEILMPQEKSIIVNGTLHINGSAENPVVIRPNAFSESWGALCFVNAQDTSLVNYLNIYGATKGVDFGRDRAAISAYNSHLILNYIYTENVLSPVLVQYGSVIIRNCTLRSSTAGDLINVKYASAALVENCNLQGNNYFDSDAVDYDDLSNGIIRNNHIYNFYGFNSDAIDLGEGAKDVLVEGNVIYNINDKGLSIGGASTGIIKRNVFANCGQGAGIKDYDSYGYFEHNTFYANQIGIASFVKNTGAGGGSADAVNCLFSANRTSAVYVDNLSYCNVSYSLSDTDELPGLHNILDDAGLLNDLYPGSNSAALNSGNPTLPADPDGSLPDMGAYPFSPQHQSTLLINEIHYNPQEGSDYEFIEITNRGTSSIELNGYKISGDISFTFPAVELEPGAYLVVAKNMMHFAVDKYPVLQWDSGTLPDGPGQLILCDSQNDTIDFVHYDSKFWWPQEANGQGPSLELINPEFENMVSLNWRSSYQPGGTPGSSNNSVVISNLYINELMASNGSVISDENGDYDDWIEMYNASDREINLAGLYLTDKQDNLLKYYIPNDERSVISARDYVLFWADEQGSQGSNHVNFKLDKDGEWIGLVQVTDTDTILIDSVSFAGQETDVSYGRVPDGSANWKFLSTPTPLDSNIVSHIIDPDVPLSFSLSQNYPNPFNPVTTIHYNVGKNNHSVVELSIFNILGQKVTTLVSQKLPAGKYEAVWDASGLATGLYFCQLKKGTKVMQTRKLILLK